MNMLKEKKKKKAEKAENQKTLMWKRKMKLY